MIVAAVHTYIDINVEENHPSYLYLLPITAFFIPSLYAAVTFGVSGAVPTALLSTLLTTPNIFIFHHGAERIGVAIQFVLILFLGVLVGLTVDRERTAKQAAEAANRKLADARKSLENYIGKALHAQEEERHRLARELHDETIQDLVMVKIALESLPTATNQLNRIKSIDDELQRSIDGIRRLCRALRPSVLDDLGLLPALESLVAEVNSRTDVQTSLNVLGIPVRLGADRELAIFRIAQETFRNVERHARATEAVVRFTYRPDGVRLEIHDNGEGFQRDQRKNHEGGLGLAGMQERARLIGATIQITSAPGDTHVVLDLPTNPDAISTPTLFRASS